MALLGSDELFIDAISILTKILGEGKRPSEYV